MSTIKEPAVHVAIGKKWAVIFGGVAAILTVVVPPIVTMVRGGSSATASGNGIAIAGDVSIMNYLGSAWMEGARTILGVNANSSNSTQQAQIPPAFVPTAPAPQSPASQVSPSLPSFPKYEDKYLRAMGMTSSLGNNGLNTVIPVRIENKTESDLLIGHDFEVVTAIADTGETNLNTAGCNLKGVRSFHLSNLQKPYDPLIFTAISPGASTTLQVGCPLTLAEPKKVTHVNVNIPLIRLDGENVKRFTLNIDRIPTFR